MLITLHRSALGTTLEIRDRGNRAVSVFSMADPTFLGLPLEVRNMIYRELLVIDHNSKHWEWSFASLGAFNQRHGIIRVNAQLRLEAQKYLYGSIPWLFRVEYPVPDPWEIRELRMISKILQMFTAVEVSYIRELTFVFVMDDVPKTESLATDYSRNYIGLVCKHLSAVQRLNISWYDHNINIDWDEKQASLLEPLAALQHVSSILIREACYQNGPRNDKEFAKLVNDIVAGDMCVRDVDIS